MKLRFLLSLILIQASSALAKPAWLDEVCADVKDVKVSFNAAPINDQLISELKTRVDRGECAGLKALPGCEDTPDCKESCATGPQAGFTTFVKRTCDIVIDKMHPSPQPSAVLAYGMMVEIENYVNFRFETQRMSTEFLSICLSGKYSKTSNEPKAVELRTLCKKIETTAIPEIKYRNTLMRIARAKSLKLGSGQAIPHDKPWLTSAIPGFYWSDKQLTMDPLTPDELKIARGEDPSKAILPPEYIDLINGPNALPPEDIYHLSLSQTPLLTNFRTSELSDTEIAKGVSQTRAQMPDAPKFSMSTANLHPWLVTWFLDKYTKDNPQLKKKYCQILDVTFQLRPINEVGQGILIGMGLTLVPMAAPIVSGGLAVGRASVLSGAINSYVGYTYVKSYREVQELQSLNSFCKQTAMDGSMDRSRTLGTTVGMCDTQRMTEVSDSLTMDAIFAGGAFGAWQGGKQTLKRFPEIKNFLKEVAQANGLMK